MTLLQLMLLATMKKSFFCLKAMYVLLENKII